ncbi:hypothetical protein ACFS3C_09090 [Azotobacter vinelandii]
MFDLFGGHAAGLGHQGDGRLVEVGEDIHGHARQSESTVDHQYQTGDHHQRAVAETVVEKPLEHAVGSFSGSG